MKTFFLIVLLMASPVLAADIYRCGNTFTDKPCGSKIMVNAPMPSCDDRVAATARHYQNLLKLQEIEFSQREDSFVRARLSAPVITQIVDVENNSSSWSGSSSSSESTSLLQNKTRKK